MTLRLCVIVAVLALCLSPTSVTARRRLRLGVRKGVIQTGRHDQGASLVGEREPEAKTSSSPPVPSDDPHQEIRADPEDVLFIKQFQVPKKEHGKRPSKHNLKVNYPDKVSSVFSTPEEKDEFYREVVQTHRDKAFAYEQYLAIAAGTHPGAIGVLKKINQGMVAVQKAFQCSESNGRAVLLRAMTKLGKSPPQNMTCANKGYYKFLGVENPSFKKFVGSIGQNHVDTMVDSDGIVRERAVAVTIGMGPASSPAHEYLPTFMDIVEGIAAVLVGFPNDETKKLVQGSTDDVKAVQDWLVAEKLVGAHTFDKVKPKKSEATDDDNSLLDIALICRRWKRAYTGPDGIFEKGKKSPFRLRKIVTYAGWVYETRNNQQGAMRIVKATDKGKLNRSPKDYKDLGFPLTSREQTWLGVRDDDKKTIAWAEGGTGYDLTHHPLKDDRLGWYMGNALGSGSPWLAGPSGTTDCTIWAARLLMGDRYLRPLTTPQSRRLSPKDLYYVRLAMAHALILYGHHSYIEIVYGAEGHGVRANKQRVYSDFLPESEAKNDVYGNGKVGTAFDTEVAGLAKEKTLSAGCFLHPPAWYLEQAQITKMACIHLDKKLKALECGGKDKTTCDNITGHKTSLGCTVNPNLDCE